MTRLPLALALPLACALIALPAAAQEYPRRIEAPGGEVIIPSAGSQRAYDEIGYAPARRAGDTLYVSGAIAGAAPGEGTDAAAFEAQVRRTFQHLQRTLTAAGVTFNDVVMINSFHVWEGPGFSGTRMEQVTIIDRVKREFITGPHPAWTAVGTTGLLAPGGVVEIQLIVHAPQS
ncbi:Rid family hydrolase [Brevundimonas sp. 2R-24]|uniref:Rid family hydrolase n=1 Tax=Peiella sedimenti TaxID=3061083 RepID=A0ABT8SHM0_9CAUL|nr:Rid family hydrolase [Caulobacteraceae bacterium XZ-24]